MQLIGRRVCVVGCSTTFDGQLLPFLKLLSLGTLYVDDWIDLAQEVLLAVDVVVEDNFYFAIVRYVGSNVTVPYALT